MVSVGHMWTYPHVCTEVPKQRQFKTIKPLFLEIFSTDYFYSLYFDVVVCFTRFEFELGFLSVYSKMVK